MSLRPALAWLRSRVHGERGSLSLELVIVFPVVLLIIFGTVQGALYYHARTVALAAAEEGLRDARVENGTGAAGTQRAQAFLSDAGGNGVLRDVAISSERSLTGATITVRGSAPSVLPGVPGLPVSQSASGPLEQVTTP